MGLFTLSKEERISSRKDIENLFATGQGINSYPLRLVWIASPHDGRVPAKVMFSVSKKKFPRAVDRNRIKRLMSESYRLQKPAFYGNIPQNTCLRIAFIFNGKDLPELTAIQKGMASTLHRLIKQLSPAIQ